MKKNGYSLTEMLMVIGFLGIVTLIVISSTSYSFKDNSEDYYDQIKYVIINQAKEYAKTLDNLKEEKNLVITLDDMVKADYYVADTKDGLVKDPRNSNASLNSLKIKLTYDEEGKIKASIIEEE